MGRVSYEEEILAHGRASRLAQGLPPTITDPVAIRGALLLLDAPCLAEAADKGRRAIGGGHIDTSDEQAKEVALTV